MASKRKVESMLNFAQVLADEGDMFFSCGDVDQDYDNVVSIIKSHGYWAGGYLRYFFDEELSLIRTEKREFGK